MAGDGLVQGRLTDDSVALMRERIGFPNPSLRSGVLGDRPWITAVSVDAIRNFAVGIGDMNPLYLKPEYASQTRWGGPIAPPGIEMAMGWRKNRPMEPDFEKRTSKALRGVHLFHSGTETFYWRPLGLKAELSFSQWVEDVTQKQSSFGGRSAIVTNGFNYWDQHEQVCITGANWFVHTERRTVGEKEKSPSADLRLAPFTDDQLAEIERAYDQEYIRGSDTLYFEDVTQEMALPRMVKGPMTITDLINMHMGSGWFTYGNPPFRLAYENRKVLRGFYARNEFNAWDTIQRVHWDAALAQAVGVPAPYDIGPMRQAFINHYCTNFAGDDAWVLRLRCEFRKFNFMGDVTWLTGALTHARIDERWGPLIEISVRGENQRGEENVRGEATILLPSRVRGPVVLPDAPPMTPFRAA
ncbi:MAG: MaoC family dehydratase N-terminal domain-containing protein [Hyphomonadaceae bacterium]|nr:MaoC family dehydratase N-terminal domain-containing protein [Hyphomonadaceae bacterium]